MARMGTYARKLRISDLCAGIGGFRLAAGDVECVMTCEIDTHARNIYGHNFPDLSPIHRDIRTLDSLPEHDLLTAGFPCQPFSKAGRRQGFADPRGSIFGELVRLIGESRPKAFLLENVMGFKKHMPMAQDALEGLGYDVSWTIQCSSPWVPQRRKRLFIVGFRESNAFSFDDMPIPSTRPVLGDVLQEHVHPRYRLGKRTWECLQRHQQKHRGRGNGFGYTMGSKLDSACTLPATYGNDGSECLLPMDDGGTPRMLTPREVARCFGFPDTFRFTTGSDRKVYARLGNAVVVPQVRAIIDHMRMWITCG